MEFSKKNTADCLGILLNISARLVAKKAKNSSPWRYDLICFAQVHNWPHNKHTNYILLIKSYFIQVSRKNLKATPSDQND